ncbi:hypothetical protein SAMN05421539_12332 [Jannaschia seohaensis]|uniref:Uncharacterized protein n=1 Tax=Jannaschia seohaensis TaxID=475081 RepID=A0A2Y9BBL8_9RHOB|nr:hypothetical protein BCF38_12332 [Jannaschia seohaensis]SSA51679.1 hypothetical protein SAMN05421539_12332 [Jannaschia seohaensis]
MALSQILCLILLPVPGATAGWVLDHSVFPAILGAAFAGGIDMLLSIVKYVIH